MFGNKWNGALFSNVAEMADAIAYDYMTAGGLNSSETIDNFLQTTTPTELAGECCAEWNIPLSEQDILPAFVRFSINRPDKTVSLAELVAAWDEGDE